MMNKRYGIILLCGLLVGLAIAVFSGLLPLRGLQLAARSTTVRGYLANPGQYDDQAVTALSQCGEAPFLMPTSGLIGYVWDDSFRPLHRHSGLDIFGPTRIGETPVYAAYDGYLHREQDWEASLILRIPEDPLHPGEQIWLYYTHLADEDGLSFIEPGFPPGTHDVFVAAGTLLGYQGNYSGDPINPVGVHLHFSIVRSSPSGGYLNETEIHNTLDPSPYFGFALSQKSVGGRIPVCP